MSRDLPRTISEGAAWLRAGVLSSRELTTEMLKRADELDPQLGTYLARFDESALAAAARADADFAAGTERSLLQGIPVGIKDVLASREGVTTAQSLVVKPSPEDARGRPSSISATRWRRGHHGQDDNQRVRPGVARSHEAVFRSPATRGIPGCGPVAPALEQQTVSRRDCSSADSGRIQRAAFECRPPFAESAASSRPSVACQSQVVFPSRTASTLWDLWHAVPMTAPSCWAS